MSTFIYKLQDKNGRVHTSRVDADNVYNAAALAKKEGYTILDLKEDSISNSVFSFKQKGKLSSFERINFTDHLASLISAGTPITEALEVYIDDTSKKSEMIESIIKNIEQGKKLSTALSEFPHVFSPIYISLVKAGEATGNLDETLSYLANELRRENEFIQKVRTAMFYPGFVLTVAFFVISLIIVVVIPKIIEITKDLSGDIPTVTRIVISISSFLSNYGIFLIAGVIFSVIGLLFLLRVRETKEAISAKLLDFPMIGPIMRKYILARFTRIIASSVKYGLSLTIAFDSVSEVVGNIRYREACNRINKRIIRGVTLSDAISAEGEALFPPILSRTIRGAEKTGSVDVALNRLSVQYESELDRDLKRITELIEPVLVFVLGIIVLGIAISVIAPIYQITSKIK